MVGVKHVTSLYVWSGVAGARVAEKNKVGNAKTQLKNIFHLVKPFDFGHFMICGYVERASMLFFFIV